MAKMATVNSVDHALRLVELMAESRQASTVSQLALALDLPRATLYRLLNTLMQRHWVVQSGSTYELTPRLRELLHEEGGDEEAALIERVTPLLHRLVSETRETAHLAALDGDRVVYLAKVDSPHPIRMFSRVGWRGPLHATAAGKVLLAAADASLLERICDEGLERFTPKTIVQRQRLEAELAQVRAQGHAVDDEELIDGLTCVSVPILDGERVLGAVSVAGPSTRLGATDTLAEIVRRTVDT
jgi:DNA-binding IclR family transcriptional regulator